jgi:hypothetical protein
MFAASFSLPAAVMTDAYGKPILDPDRRDTENVPLDEDVEAYLNREVRPHVPGAWCPDHEALPASSIGCVRRSTRPSLVSCTTH